MSSESVAVQGDQVDDLVGSSSPAMRPRNGVIFAVIASASVEEGVDTGVSRIREQGLEVPGDGGGGEVSRSHGQTP